MSEQEEYNGYPNRATWLFPLHFPEFLEDNAENIWMRCTASWDQRIDDDLTVEEFIPELRYMAATMIHRVLDDIVGRAESDAADAIWALQNLFISDMVHVHEPFSEINTNYLTTMYLEEYIDGVKEGRFACDIYDIAVANDKRREDEKRDYVSSFMEAWRRSV